jgi:hypothetical protein
MNEYMFCIDYTHVSGEERTLIINADKFKLLFSVPQLIEFYQRNINGIGKTFTVTCAGEYDGIYNLIKD